MSAGASHTVLLRADGHAVKELLKLSSLLMTAIQTSTSSGQQVRHSVHHVLKGTPMRCQIVVLRSFTNTCLRCIPRCVRQDADGPPLDMALFDLGSKLSQMKVSQY